MYFCTHIIHQYVYIFVYVPKSRLPQNLMVDHHCPHHDDQNIEYPPFVENPTLCHGQQWLASPSNMVTESGRMTMSRRFNIAIEHPHLQ